MKRIARIANEYIAWATEQFSADRKMIPAEVRLCNFCDTRGLSRETKTALYWHLVGIGSL